MPRTAIVVTRQELGGEAARSLIEALDAELSGRYPEQGATFFALDTGEVAPGRGAFLVGTLDGKPVACGAIRRLDAHTAEVKRMYVAPQARNRGFGRLLLAALEAEAQELSITRLVLETGSQQPEALSLYERTGFVRIPAFGEYVHSPLGICMEKRTLNRAGARVRRVPEPVVRSYAGGGIDALTAVLPRNLRGARARPRAAGVFR